MNCTEQQELYITQQQELYIKQQQQLQQEMQQYLQQEICKQVLQKREIQQQNINNYHDYLTVQQKKQQLNKCLYNRIILYIALVPLENRYINFNNVNLYSDGTVLFKSINECMKIDETRKITIEGEQCIIADTSIIYGVDRKEGEVLGVYDRLTNKPILFYNECFDHDINKQIEPLKTAIEKFHNDEDFIQKELLKIKNNNMASPVA